MLRWRLLIGIPLVAFLLTLCWLDMKCSAPGMLLTPFFLVCVFFLCKEILALLNAGGVYPRRSTIFVGIFGAILLCWGSCLNGTTLSELTSGLQRTNAAATASVESDAPSDAASESAESSTLSETHEWRIAALASLHILLAIAAGVFIAFIGEMLRFRSPGGHLINLSGAVFAIIYIGALGSFIIMLRTAFGLMALLSMIFVAKMCDVGAYTVGRIFGRHKMAPSLSPGKTIEGIIGGMIFAIATAALSVKFLFPLESGAASTTSALGIVIYGIAVGAAGALGDLAESLIKRDVSRKDSGRNVPGFGGFLDIFDSLLLAAPVAFALWAYGIIRL
ncbi:MAG: phosphatidate cytidylyltransferase [Thermoguttaceae bacterium]|nr:phosphatidate cytidylyltransferase [Thermoguttaceae bacterium]